MRDEVVDAFGVLLDGYLVERLHRDVAHRAIRLGHDVSLVPVVGRRGDDFVEVLRRTSAAYLVDAGHREVLADKHQVASHTGGVHNLLLVLMAGGEDAVLSRPVADGLHEALAVERGVQAKEEVSGPCRRAAYVVPKSGIECFGRETVTYLELLVEVACPHAALCPVHRRLVEERRDYGLSEVVGKVTVVRLVCVLDKQLDGLR